MLKRDKPSATNKNNELIILGITGSSDFPTTTGAYDTTFNGGTSISPLHQFYFFSSKNMLPIKRTNTNSE